MDLMQFEIIDEISMDASTIYFNVDEDDVENTNNNKEEQVDTQNFARDSYKQPNTFDLRTVITTNSLKRKLEHKNRELRKVNKEVWELRRARCGDYKLQHKQRLATYKIFASKLEARDNEIEQLRRKLSSSESTVQALQKELCEIRFDQRVAVPDRKKFYLRSPNSYTKKITGTMANMNLN